MVRGVVGWCDGAPVPGRPTIWMKVRQGITALAVGAGGGCLDIFTLLYPFSPLSLSLWETARYRLKYYLNGPLNPKQSTNSMVRTRFALLLYLRIVAHKAACHMIGWLVDLGLTAL